MDNCLLCGTYQKFYSSLKSLYDFSKTEDFFDMISCLDKFFSEFRSITFVLQKSINGTQYEDVYSNLKNKYLCNETMKWFINKRNETLKEMPFNLRRVIVVDVYFFGKSKKIIDSSYTYENWTNINKIKSEIKKDLKQYNFPEIYLSTKLRFMDGEKDIDIFELIKYGINSMSDFLHDFDKDVNIECRRCKKLKEKILKVITDIVANKLMLESDYEYIPKTNKLEPKSIMESMGILNNNVETFKEMRGNIKDNPLFYGANTLDEMFESFIFLHTYIYASQGRKIMPTIFTFYSDNTFSLEPFLAESKSTVYRKINKVADNILKEKIEAVFVVWESYLMSLDRVNFEDRYDERVKNADKTLLCFYFIDKSLAEKTTTIDSNLIEEDKNLPIIIKHAISKISNDYEWQVFSSLKQNFALKYHKYLNLKKL